MHEEVSFMFLMKELSEVVFTLPTDKPIRNDLLQRISRISGAFTENWGLGNVYHFPVMQRFE